VNKEQTLVLLGERVKQLRLKKGISQRKLADIMGKDHPAISLLENGKTNPSFWFLLELTSALDVELIDLVEGFKLSADH
jgi:transcriptional regulator with XRE-family HTH domain